MHMLHYLWVAILVACKKTFIDQNGVHGEHHYADEAERVELTKQASSRTGRGDDVRVIMPSPWKMKNRGNLTHVHSPKLRYV
jgi:hypothetical protein